MTRDVADPALLRRLGARVRALRIAQSLTARSAAERAGLSPRFYAQLEAGQANISIGRLARVASALAATLSDLLAEETTDEARAIVALLGLRGAGKSTIGPQVARILGVAFVELDERVEQAAGLELAEIFALHGEAYYRRLETRCLSELVGAGDGAVVALSGGVVQNPESFELLRRRCTTVWLQATPEAHMLRVLEQGDMRPVTDRTDAMAELRAILSAREPLYGQADIRVDTSAGSLEAAVATLVSRVAGRSGAAYGS